MKTARLNVLDRSNVSPCAGGLFNLRSYVKPFRSWVMIVADVAKRSLRAHYGDRRLGAPVSAVIDCAIDPKCGPPFKFESLSGKILSSQS